MSDNDKWVPTICRLCTEGPEPIRVHVINGVAVSVEGNASGPGPGFGQFAKNRGRVCAKPFGMIHKLYNPYRIKGPLKRTNPQKGRGIDPKFQEISWDEALGIIAARLGKIRATDTNRLSLGDAGPHGATLSGTWDAFFKAFGPVQSLLNGGGSRCFMEEHVFGNLIHGGFHCQSDLLYCNYLILMGNNPAAVGGAAQTVLYNDAKARGMKIVVVDPVFSLTASKADTWLPIKPGTDLAFLLALIHVIVNELEKYDAEYLKTLTNSPYLVGNDGYFVRDSDGKILVWDRIAGKAKAHDAADIQDFALEGRYVVNAMEARPAFQVLKDHVGSYTPEWASTITDIAADKIRKVAREYVEAAQIGSTIQIEGITLPLRPVSIKFARGVSGQMRSYQCSLANHILAVLVGALEVPGGHGGGRVGAGDLHHDGVRIHPGPDGMSRLETYPWTWPPVSYSGAETLLPYSKVHHPGNAKHLAYRNLVEPPKNFPIPPPPEVYFRYRCNPLLSVGEPKIVYEALRRIPFIVSLSYLADEVTELADIILPEHQDLERYELTAVMRDATARKNLGALLRQPVVEPLHNTMEISEIFTELAQRMGFMDEYNAAINAQLGLTSPYKLDAGKRYSWVEIVDRHCKSVTGGLYDLEWFRQNGGYLKPVPVTHQYDTHPYMVATKLRYHIPYMEHVKKKGVELARNLAEVGVDWWPTEEYVALPTYFPSILEEVPKEYDFYVTTCRSAQFSYGSTIECPWLMEAAALMPGQTDIIMNAEAAKAKGIKNGDEVWVESDVGKVKRKVKLTEGIRPDTVLIGGQFGQWAMPGAKETGRVNQTTLTPIRHGWTDHVMSNMQGQTVKAKVYKA